MSKDDLRQADLSNLTITEMTPAQRAELKRRYSHFVESFGPADAKSAAEKPAPKPKKWVPGKKARG
jgi:hypothetical protein